MAPLTGKVDHFQHETKQIVRLQQVRDVRETVDRIGQVDASEGVHLTCVASNTAKDRIPQNELDYIAIEVDQAVR